MIQETPLISHSPEAASTGSCNTEDPSLSPTATTHRPLIPKIEFIPREPYASKDFNWQTDLSSEERAVLRTIHELDHGTARGCHVTNEVLAAYSRKSETWLKKTLQRLSERGYLFTIGFDPSTGLIFRRVRLKYVRIPGVDGSATYVRMGSVLKRRSRKTKEPDPSVCLREELPARRRELAEAKRNGTVRMKDGCAVWIRNINPDLVS